MKAGFILFDRQCKFLHDHRGRALAKRHRLFRSRLDMASIGCPQAEESWIGDLEEEALKSMGIARGKVGKSFFTPNGRLGGESKSLFKFFYGFEPEFKTSTNGYIELSQIVSMNFGGVPRFGTLIALFNLSFPPFVKILNENVFQGIPGP